MNLIVISDGGIPLEESRIAYEKTYA